MNEKEVARHQFLSLKAFNQYMSSAGEPVIIDGWIDGWSAFKKWDFSFFAELCGDTMIEVAPALVKPSISFRVPLSDYVAYILQSDDRLQRLATTAEIEKPLYAYSFKPFRSYPELLEDFSLPPFVEDWFPSFSPEFRRRHFPREQGWILMGPKDVCSHLHFDAYSTIAWLAQLRGRKRCVFFSPNDSPYLYGGSVDPLNPNLDLYPDFVKATPYSCELHPGSMVFLPPNWWHHVVALDSCLTLSYNMVNQSNLGAYLQHAYRDHLDRALNLLPPTL